jgi:hypothetical protein
MPEGVLDAVARALRLDDGERTSGPRRPRGGPKCRPAPVGPRREYLRKRRAGELGTPVAQLLREIRELS